MRFCLAALIHHADWVQEFVGSRQDPQFCEGVLKHLTKIRLDTRYFAFAVFLNMPKTVKVRKVMTSRIVRVTDI